MGKVVRTPKMRRSLTPKAKSNKAVAGQKAQVKQTIIKSGQASMRKKVP